MRTRMKNLVRWGTLTLAALLVAACGFRPIYATSAQDGAPLNRRIAIGDVAAPEIVQPMIVSALSDRIVLQDGESPRYQLGVVASESAERLAVQIDATVTRYNYRLAARYTLTDLATGAKATGRARAVTSYNIVSSQYSTLFAERSAQEKAAAMLAAEIERDLLVSFAENLDGAGTAPIGLDPETEILTAPRSGEVIETRGERLEPDLLEPIETPDEE